MERGNWTRHTMGGSAIWMPNQTPPAPSLEASQYPAKSAGAGSKSVQGTGSRSAFGRRASQSVKACRVVELMRMVRFL